MSDTERGSGPRDEDEEARSDTETGSNGEPESDGDDDSVGADEMEDEEFVELRERATADNAMWQLFRDYGHGQRLVFVLGAVASATAIGVGLLPAYFLGVAIDTLFEQQPFTLPLVSTGWLPSTMAGQFWLLVALLGGAYALQSVMNFLNNWMWNHFAQHLQHEIRTAAYDAMQRLELRFFEDRQTGEIMSILNNDVNQLQGFLTNNLNQGIRIVIQAVGIGAIMLLLNWQLALVSFVVIPVVGVASYKFVNVIHPKYKDVREAVGHLNSRLENNLSGIAVVKAFTTEEFEHRRVEDASRDYLDTQWDAIWTRIRFWPAMQAIASASYMFTFVVGGWWVVFGPPLVFSQPLSSGMLVTFLLYSRRFINPMRRVGHILNNYQYAQAASERIVGLLNKPKGVVDRADAVELGAIDGRVTFEHVSFRYDENRADRDGAAWVLRDVDFTIEPGELVGVVGPTGAGKSTLTKLLLRFYDVNRGAVRIDGHDIRDLSRESLRESIGYVSQEPFLFYGTVRENISYGLDEVDDEAVRTAAIRSGAHEFVRELGDEYDTMVGERGVKLSGGQRQRIAIARAILKDPDLVILDEATSHVDNEMEVLIQESLDELIADRTTFAIAHRLSTVRDADRILVLDDGELVEEGPHEALLERDGLYTSLWSVQVGEVDSLPDAFVERVTDRHDRLPGT